MARTRGIEDFERQEADARAAFVWTYHSNKAMIGLHKREGFKEVAQLVMSLIPEKARGSISGLNQLHRGKENA